MLSKEEIEKAKGKIEDILNFEGVSPHTYNIIPKSQIFIEKEYVKILLQYIDQLEADNYECNNIIKDYIAERNNLIDKMKADRMEQFDDYVIYLIEKYLKELGALEDE